MKKLLATRRVRTIVASAMLAFVVAGGLTACSGQNSGLVAQYQEGNNKGFIAADFAVQEFKAGHQPRAVTFDGTLADGEKVSSADYKGRVTVVNFWYAACAPCRAEAPKLEQAYKQFSGQPVSFLGVDTYDQAATAQSFAQQFHITYPTVIDLPDKTVTAAFTDVISLNATPTTVVLGRDGRPTARIVGELPATSILTSLVNTALGAKS